MNKGKLYSLNEAAARLGISTKKLLEMQREKLIFGVRVGSDWKYQTSELDRVSDYYGLYPVDAEMDEDDEEFALDEEDLSYDNRKQAGGPSKIESQHGSASSMAEIHKLFKVKDITYEVLGHQARLGPLVFTDPPYWLWRLISEINHFCSRCKEWFLGQEPVQIFEPNEQRQKHKDGQKSSPSAAEPTDDILASARQEHEDAEYTGWTEKEILQWVQNLHPAYQEQFWKNFKEFEGFADRRGLTGEARRVYMLRYSCKIRHVAERAIAAATPKWYEYFADATLGWTIGGIVSGTKKLK